MTLEIPSGRYFPSENEHACYGDGTNPPGGAIPKLYPPAFEKKQARKQLKAGHMETTPGE